LVRPSLKQCVHIGGIISELLKTHKQTCGRELTLILEIWEDALGEQISGHARPAAYKNRLLWVEVANSVWHQQLQFLKPDMIARINHKLGIALVENIKFKVGRHRS
jgi:predicted nucleic acid-binding Zn ribbon protein